MPMASMTAPTPRRLRALAAPVALAAGAAAMVGVLPADARSGAQDRPIHRSPLLWATVNVCDTPARPNTVGIRASMPGSGFRRERMYARFQVQYLSALDGRWHNMGASGDSGWVKLGSARYRARQAGRDFLLQAPQEGTTFRVRGAVTFEWRRGTRVVRRARKATESGHPGTRGADPEQFSAASCVIT